MQEILRKVTKTLKDEGIASVGKKARSYIKTKNINIVYILFIIRFQDEKSNGKYGRNESEMWLNQKKKRLVFGCKKRENIHVGIK